MVLSEIRDERVRRRQRRLLDRQRPRRRRERLVVLGRRVQRRAEVVEDAGHRRVGGAQRPLDDADGAPLVLRRLVELALAQVHEPDVGERGGDRLAHRPESRLAERERAQVVVERLGEAVLGEEEDAVVVEELRQRPRPAAGRRDQGERAPAPLVALVAPALIIADDADEPDGGVGRDLGAAAGLGGEEGLAQELLGGLAIADVVLDDADEVERRGEDRLVTDGAGLGGGRRGGGERGGELAGGLERPRLGEAALDRVEAPAEGGVAGRRLGLVEEGEVPAIGDRRQPLRRLHRALDRLAVGAGQHLGEGVEAAAPLGEAGHAQVEEALGLLAADPRRLAGLGVHAGPGGRVVVELAARDTVGVGGEAAAGGEERGADLVAHAVVPDRREVALGVLAHEAPPLADREGDGRRRDRERRADEDPAPPRRRRIARDLIEEGVHRREALRRVAPERPLERPPEKRRHVRLARGLGGRVDDPRQGERPAAVERLVERDREAELIAARVDGAAVALLGRHVRRGADAGAGARQRLEGRRGARLGLTGLGRADAARQPEVEDAHPSVGADDHVLGLEVAVDDAERVRRGEAAPGGEVDVADLAPRAPPLVTPGAERAAWHVLHRDEHALAERADVVHGDDVGVGEARQRASLAEEPRAPLGIARAVEVGPHDLDGDGAIELGVVRGIDDAHAAGAEPFEDRVAPDAGPGR